MKIVWRSCEFCSAFR